MLNWADVIRFASNGNPTPDRRVEKSAAEWRAQLTPERYRVTRGSKTEMPFSS